MVTEASTIVDQAVASFVKTLANIETASSRGLVS
jgi:hypothetical protein